MKNILLLFNIAIFNSLFAQTFIPVIDCSLNIATNSNGIAVADYDLDGDLDVYIVGADRFNVQNEETWNRFFSNNGNGTFSEVTKEANIRGYVSSPHEGFEGAQFGAAWGDYDNNGYPDLYLTNFGYNTLYRNNGNGTFSDVTGSAGVRGRLNDHNSSACWWDYDLDGDLDLYVSAWVGENIMYENMGQGIFTNITVQTGLGDNGQTWTSLPIDANNDQLFDLYVVNDFGPNKFYLNQGDSTFREATEEFGLEDEGNGMGVALGDYNNDGYFDIYITNISSTYHCPLFENQGNGTFIDKAEEVGVGNSGWAWGTEFLDFDHDGAVDLYVVNGHRELNSQNNYFYYNLLESELAEPELPGAYFWNVSDSSGVNSKEIARSLVTFDYDDDGDLDMIVGNKWTHPHFYENISKTKNWLKIELEGTISNRNAFGAIISVTCGEKKYYRSNDGIDFLGQSILPLHFGLADANVADSVIVSWPTGEKEIFTDIPVNQTIKIIEKDGLVSGIQKEKRAYFKTDLYLIGNYPNPFNSSTRIVFNAPYTGVGQIKVFNILGMEVFTRDLIVNNGQNIINWHGTNIEGRPVSSGLYLYTIILETDQFLSGKLVYIK